MGGGLMQLVAYGAQDVYLTGNPQITFFKVVYRRYTNFAIETVELNMNGTADFGKRVTVTITRNGDLVTRMYLRIELGQVTMNNFPFKDCSFLWFAIEIHYDKPLVVHKQQGCIWQLPSMGEKAAKLPNYCILH